MSAPSSEESPEVTALLLLETVQSHNALPCHQGSDVKRSQDVVTSGFSSDAEVLMGSHAPFLLMWKLLEDSTKKKQDT